MEDVNLEKKLTANQLFKEYKDEGGTLAFSDWLSREKTKGIFPINSNLNKEIGEKLFTLKKEEMDKKVLGFPLSTLLIAGGVIIVAIVAANESLNLSPINNILFFEIPKSAEAFTIKPGMGLRHKHEASSKCGQT